MKKIFAAFLFLSILCVGALAFFVLTFDVSKYKPRIEEEARKALGNPVKIGDVSLGWKNGLALEVFDIRVIEDDKPVLTLDAGSATLRLLPLLSSNLEVAFITLDSPKVTAIRDAKGVVTIRGIQQKSVEDGAQESPETPSDNSSLESSPVDDIDATPINVLISRIHIENGEFAFVDQNPEFPVNVAIQDFDLEVKNISLHRPIDYSLDFKLLSDKQNIHSEGRVRLLDEGEKIVLEPVGLDADFTELELNTLLKALPKLADVGFKSVPRGHVSVNVEKVDLSPEGLNQITAELKLTEGFVALKDLPAEVSNIRGDILYQTNAAEVKSLKADIADGSVDFSGSFVDLLAVPKSNFSLSANQLSLNQLVPKQKGMPEVHGDLSLNFKARAEGKEPPQISRTLSGNGQIILKDALIKDINLLREALQKLSAIPGMAGIVDRKFSNKYEEKLSMKDTKLNPIEQDFSIQQGVVTLPEYSVGTEDFKVEGNAKVSLIGHVDTQAIMALSPQLSSELSRMVNELEYVLDKNGSLVVPVNVSGQNPNLKVSMNVQSLLSNLLRGSTQKQLNKLVGKAFGSDGEGTTSDQPLANLLQQALGGTPVSQSSESANAQEVVVEQPVTSSEEVSQSVESVNTGDAGMLLSSLLQNENPSSGSAQELNSGQAEPQSTEDAAAQLIGGFLRKALND